MYAARRIPAYNWYNESSQDKYEIQFLRDGKPIECIDTSKLNFIEEEVMTWRKANHIHQWFVENVQNGEDDCGTYDVSFAKLRELLSLCQRVMEASELVPGKFYAGTVYDKKHPNGLVKYENGKVIKDHTVAAELLPTQSGFFFGSLEYDEWYLQNVIATHDWIVEMLDEQERGVPGHIVYSSSW